MDLNSRGYKILQLAKEQTENIATTGSSKEDITEIYNNNASSSNDISKQYTTLTVFRESMDHNGSSINTNENFYSSLTLVKEMQQISRSPSYSSPSSLHSGTDFDSDDLMRDKTYVAEETTSEEMTSDVENETAINVIQSASRPCSSSLIESPVKKGRKRNRDERLWTRNVKKKLRNSGKEYQINNEISSIRKTKTLKNPCLQKCRLKCHTKFTELERLNIFEKFWELADIQKQRQFIINCLVPIVPKYKYILVNRKKPERNSNNGFYFHLNNVKINNTQRMINVSSSIDQIT